MSAQLGSDLALLAPRTLFTGWVTGASTCRYSIWRWMV